MVAKTCLGSGRGVLRWYEEEQREVDGHSSYILEPSTPGYTPPVTCKNKQWKSGVM